MKYIFLKPLLEHNVFCFRQQLPLSGLCQGNQLFLQRSLATVCHRLMDDLLRGSEWPFQGWVQATGDVAGALPLFQWMAPCALTHSCTVSLAHGALGELANWCLKTAVQIGKNTNAEFGMNKGVFSGCSWGIAAVCCCSRRLSPPHIPPMMAEDKVEPPRSSAQCSVPALGEGYTGSSTCFSFCALHPLLLPTSYCFLRQSCSELPSLVSLLFHHRFIWFVYMYVCLFFTVLAPSFCLLVLHLVLSCFFPFMFLMSWIAQYITKYHSVTLYHIHLLLLLFQAAPPPK